MSKPREMIVEDIRVTEKDFNAGAKARLGNKLALANPHDKHKDPHRHYSWLMGWIKEDEAAPERLVASEELKEGEEYQESSEESE